MPTVPTGTALRRARGAAVILALQFLALCAAAAFSSAASAVPAPLTPSIVGELPQGHGVFRFPQAVAVAAGGSRVFVGDQYSGVVQAFDGQGNFLFSVGSRAPRGENGRLGVVGGVAVDQSNHLFVLDSENDRVQVFDASNGQFISTFGSSSVFNLMSGSPSTGAGISASGIAVYQSAQGAPIAIYVADTGNDRVERFSVDPNSLLPTGAPLISPPGLGLSAPQGLTVDATGSRVYVADDDNARIVVIDANNLGGLMAGGTPPPSQFAYNPYDVSIDGSSPPKLYVADNLNGAVQVFDATTLQYLTKFGTQAYGPGTGNLQIVRALGAVPGTLGNGTAVTDTANNRIQTFDATGAVTAAWGIAGRGPGYVTRPRGVAFTPSGGVAIADSFDQRIALFAPDGTYVGQRGRISATNGYATQGNAPGQRHVGQGCA